MRTITTGLMLAVCTMGMGQIKLDKVIERSTRKAEHQVEKRIERRIDKGVNKGLDAAEGEIDNSVKGTSGASAKKSEPGTRVVTGSATSSGNHMSADEEAIASSGGASGAPSSVLEWSSFDFVPGQEVLFEDNHVGELNGEFPGKWDLKSGVVENAVFNGQNVIFFRQAGNLPNGIVPLIKGKSAASYLPEAFTLEFDCYFEGGKYHSYSVFFYDTKVQKRILDRLDIHVNSARYGSLSEKQYPNTLRSNTDKESKWRRVSVSFNKRALKVYLDDVRMLNIPNLEVQPTGIALATALHTSGNYFVKDVRLSRGAVPLYDKVLTDGKFVTTGIRFDVNQATLRPESAGTLNYVYQMMSANPSLCFSVEGHTDSDGDDATNLGLSEARAQAVKTRLIEMGIASSRLSSRGFGESKPLVANDTPEEKAQNRRVEFVKIN